MKVHTRADSIAHKSNIIPKLANVDGRNSWEIANTKIKYYLPAAGAVHFPLGPKVLEDNKNNGSSSSSSQRSRGSAMCHVRRLNLNLNLTAHIHTYKHTDIYESMHVYVYVFAPAYVWASVSVWAHWHTEPNMWKWWQPDVEHCAALPSSLTFSLTLCRSLCVRVIVSFGKLRMQNTVGLIMHVPSKINEIAKLLEDT